MAGDPPPPSSGRLSAPPRNPQARHARGHRAGGCEDLAFAHLTSGVDRLLLQPLLGAEVREHAALAHPQLPGQPTDREARPALDRGQAHRHVEGGGLGLFAVRASSGRGVGRRGCGHT